MKCLFAAFIKQIVNNIFIQFWKEKMTMMTMNMAGGIALALCLTVTSGQQGADVPQINLPPSTQLSFATEENTNK